MTRKVPLSEYLVGVPSLPIELRKKGLRTHLSEKDEAQLIREVANRTKLIRQRRNRHQARYGQIYIEPPTLPE